MIIGGCSFSMAGGIKISRIITFLKSIITAIQITFVKGEENEYDLEAKKSYEQIPAIVSILLFLALLIIFALLFSTLGVSFENSIFEMGSALSTNGVTAGSINVAMPVAYKWLTIVAMTIGRVEILTILLALIPIKLYESTEHSATNNVQETEKKNEELMPEKEQNKEEKTEVKRVLKKQKKSTKMGLG